VKKEDAKANGIWRQMNDEEYEREKAEIEVHLEVMMELLQKGKEDRRYGFLMRRNMKWHRLQKKQEQLMNAQWGAELLNTSECLREDLKTEASSEANRFQFFKTNVLCMFVGETGEEIQFTDVVIKEEGEGKNLNYI